MSRGGYRKISCFAVIIIIISGELNSRRAMSLWKIAEFSLFFLLPFPRGRRRKRRKKKKEGGRKVRRAKAVISEGKFVRRNEIIERRRSRIILAGVRALHRSSFGCHVPLIRGLRIEQLATVVTFESVSNVFFLRRFYNSLTN